MKLKYLIFLLVLTTWTPLLGQDGSDILYTTAHKVNKKYLGDFVHLDFYNRSFRGTTIDTISIKVEGRLTKFVEHRMDNGFNNWFDEQYLESLEKLNGLTVRIVKSRLDEITSDSLRVTNYLEYYNENKHASEKTKQITNKFPRSIIVELLVSADSHKKE